MESDPIAQNECSVCSFLYTSHIEAAPFYCMGVTLHLRTCPSVIIVQEKTSPGAAVANTPPALHLSPCKFTRGYYASALPISSSSNAFFWLSSISLHLFNSCSRRYFSIHSVGLSSSASG